MEPARNETLVRRLFAAYGVADRAAAEALLHDELTFTSPYDDGIDRATYFARCWPGAGTMRHDLREVVATGSGCIVVYDAEADTGARFRNVEVFTIRDGRIVAIEVFFGRPPGTETADRP